MLSKLALRRLGPLGMAFTAYELWMRLPAKQRRQLLGLARKHGSQAAHFVIQQGSARIEKARR
ncbi:MAG TPA: hypothetical protein VG652_03640 [Gaiellaceae bacterium]|nr:hypothetical protein [Gaiellaceae bacterium]